MNETTPMNAVSAELRLITAGRTGLENALRRDESIELIRARTALDAIGELANPIDELSPTGTLLLIGPDELGEGEAGEFIGAVRTIAPDAKVVLIGEAAADTDAFDAIIPKGASAEDLWRAIGRQSPGVAPAPEAPPPAQIDGPSEEERMSLVEEEQPPARASARAEAREPIKPIGDGVRRSESPARSPSGFGAVDALDEALLTIIGAEVGFEREDAAETSLEAALRGEDAQEAAVAELRELPGMQAVRYEPGEPSGSGAPVRRGERVYGELSCAGAERSALETAARRLARRLALDEHLRTLREAAFRDELTGAWNRRFFGRFLERSIERARARRQDLSLMIFDIDDFKTYNDRYGHAAGDEILVEVVRLLTAVVRPHDRVCRIGGDEFAVLFTEEPREASSRHPASIEALAKRFQRQICEHRFPKLGSDAMGTLTISGGLATFPWEAHDSVSLIELADELAMRSKRAGKNVITMGPGAERVCTVLAEGDGAGG